MSSEWEKSFIQLTKYLTYIIEDNTYCRKILHEKNIKESVINKPSKSLYLFLNKIDLEFKK
jgi:hypothetical protein